MKFLLSIIIVLMSSLCYSQKENTDTNDVKTLCITSENTSCATATKVCDATDLLWCFTFCDDCHSIYYSFDFTTSGSFDLDLFGYDASYILYGPINNDQSICEVVNSYSTTMQSGELNATTTSVNLPYIQGNYILQITPDHYTGGGSISGLNKETVSCEEDVPCTNCITSFQPTAGKYIVSAWVKEANASVTTTTYANSSLNISFDNSSLTYNLVPTGRIIDGWQRIEGEIIVPSTATGINIELNVSSGEANFDDIRFFPFDGSMMSYVYDPISLRLMAELDERNYATLYEYDEEGKLIRVKKETEKGVMTIQENRDNIKKSNP